MNNEKILVLDFGGQYNQLIARRVRECNVYSEVVPYDISLEKIKEKNPKGIIFTGGPANVYTEDSPKCDAGIFELGIPILGICYGMQLMSLTLGGNVARATTREYGETSVNIDNTSGIDFEAFHFYSNFRIIFVMEIYSKENCTELSNNCSKSSTCNSECRESEPSENHNWI